MKDDPAGRLWLALESLLESLPVRPKWILLAGLIAALVAFIICVIQAPKVARHQHTNRTVRP